MVKYISKNGGHYRDLGDVQVYQKDNIQGIVGLLAHRILTGYWATFRYITESAGQ